MNIRRTSASLAILGLLGLTACGEVGADEDAEAADGEEAPDLGEGEYSLASMAQGTAWYSYGIGVAGEVQEHSEDISNIEVLTYSGGIGNPELVAEGDVDLALSFNTFTEWAYEGAEGTPFEEEEFDNLRVLVGGMDEYYMGLMAPGGLEAETLQDVIDQEMGTDIFALPAGSAEEALTPMLLEAHGSSLEEIEEWGGSIEYTGVDVSADAVRDGRADLWFQSVADGYPAVTELAQQADIEFLEYTDEALDHLADEWGITAETLPAGTFHGQEEEVRLVGWMTGLVTSEDMDDEAAYAITEAVVENYQSLVDANASLEPFDPELAASEEINGSVPLHPGAEQYYRDAGLLD
ncbi:TAXI family TRAP transporter solute-binding subunit [Nesterenkonia populi]|uniref:TAXI family TRAP transporter solute-binding subunit n=1 Tax=Nesterenkonia populi TaxID=1591087 RepID=UPI0011BFB551|nr:TAXI family TRAP transporter solute-binding subunit [Nesterenkonia populi]